MKRSWVPTSAGLLFTGTKAWKLELDGVTFTLDFSAGTVSGKVTRLKKFDVVPGTFWSEVHVVVDSVQRGKEIRLDGVPNQEAQELHSAISSAIEQARQEARVKNLLKDFGSVIAPALAWAEQSIQSAKDQLRRKGWLTSEFIQRQSASKPSGPVDLLSTPEVANHVQNQPPAVQAGLKFWSREFSSFADGVNERHLAKQLSESKVFFDSVEKSPLTDEQAKAVICFDNRVLLVASAGSGKTSTMVAKAGYALRNGYVAAERMLLLAFNNDAAAELRTRIQARLGPLGLPAENIAAKTFHAFGLEVIGKATGKRPSLAPWVESGRDLEQLLVIIDTLKDRDPIFRAKWDLFRIVLGQDLPKFGKESDAPDAWDQRTKREGFWTLNNEVVKSRGEQLLANWLFYNGVQYVYEGPYEVDTADPLHRQYRPDFYFPDADAYLEHWAVDARGEPPADFIGYKEGMAWKKQVHEANGTKLLETTVADLWSGKAFKYLEAQLKRLGVELDPNPERPIQGRKPIENPRLARTFRSFITHAKSNRLDLPGLRRRLKSGVAGDFAFRHSMFIDLAEDIWNAWEVQLSSEKVIDFEDMLNIATDCIEDGRWRSPYDLVMVDEFQDASQARARLVAGLVNSPDKYLFAVGDDWQSINRFAGADLAVMTDFETKFGKSVTLRLETTFRCPQSLCDITSSFIQKNPMQLRKAVRSSKPNHPEPLSVIRVDDDKQIRTAVKMRLIEISKEAVGTGQRKKVLMLGRYKKDQAYMPQSTVEALDVDFITVHSSKGLEADHIILPRMSSETLGFPSRVADDPVLLLAMPGGDSFENAEERRLFYVALTRARETVTLITVAHKESPFVTELLRENQLPVRTAQGAESSAELCTECGSGFLMPRKSKYGLFLGCSNFPKCRNKKQIPQEGNLGDAPTKAPSKGRQSSETFSSSSRGMKRY